MGSIIIQMYAPTRTNFFHVQKKDVINLVHNTGEKLIEALFQAGHENGPSVIFVDRVEFMLRKEKKEEDQDAESKRRGKIRTAFLDQIEKDKSRTQNKVVVLATTVKPWETDYETLLVKKVVFQNCVWLRYMVKSERAAIIRSCLPDLHNISEEGIQYLARYCRNYSIAEIREMVKIAIEHSTKASSVLDVVSQFVLK